MATLSFELITDILLSAHSICWPESKEITVQKWQIHVWSKLETVFLFVLEGALTLSKMSCSVHMLDTIIKKCLPYLFILITFGILILCNSHVVSSCVKKEKICLKNLCMLLLHLWIYMFHYLDKNPCWYSPKKSNPF